MFKKSLLSISLFLFSLSSFSYRAAALSYFCILLILAHSLLSKGGVLVPAKGTLAVLVVSLSILFISSYNAVHIIYYIKYLGMIGYIYILLILYRSNSIGGEEVLSAGKFFVYAHSFFFILQLGVYLSTGTMINFDNYIRENSTHLVHSSRALEGLAIDVRATGLFSEPSFYSYTVYPIALIIGLYEKRYSLPVIIGLLTSVISFSIAAFIVAALGTAYTMLIFKKYHLAKFVVILSAVAIAPIAFEIYQLRVVEAVDYDAVGSRTLIFDEFKQRDGIRNVFGSGFLWNEFEPIGETGLRGFHTRDSSVFIYLIFSSGVVGLLATLLTLFYIFRKKKKYFIGLLIIFLFKLSILSAALWLPVIFAALLYDMEEEKDETGQGLTT